MEIVISIHGFLLTISHFLNSQEMRSYPFSLFYLLFPCMSITLFLKNESLAIVGCLGAF